MIKVNADRESSTLNSPQRTIGKLITGRYISKGTRDSPLSHAGTSVLEVPLVDPLTIPSRTNFVIPRVLLLVSDVASMVRIPPEASLLISLSYTAQVPQPQIKTLMNIPLLDASIPMNNN
ncbi:hypothetical protein FXO37_21098 [Capsicum annuum]|nr:hypothetical protein FXO37_21098 [Capsicum annuum]